MHQHTFHLRCLALFFGIGRISRFFLNVLYLELTSIVKSGRISINQSPGTSFTKPPDFYYGALFTCIKNDAVDCAKLILDQGMDLEQYQEWAGRQIMNTAYPDTLDQLKEYWSELHPENVQEPTIGGMTL